MTLRSSLFPAALALPLAFASARAADAPQDPQQQKTVKVVMLSDAKVVTSGDASDGHSIMVTAKSVDGEKPALKVKVLGADGGDGESFDLQDLEPGQTKTVTTADGKTIEVSRTDDGLKLTVDGKEIVLPQVLAGADAIPGFAHVETFVTGDDADGKDKNVFVMHGPMMAGFDDAAIDHLKALDGMDPDCREKAIAAIHELLGSGPHVGFAYAVEDGQATPGGDAQPRTQFKVRRMETAPTTPGSHVE